MKAPRTTIIYGKQELGGIIVRPDSRQVMELAAAGHPIEVTSGNDYINLYHVFERLMGSDKRRYAGMKLVRKQFGRERWRLFVVKDDSAIPEVELEEGYDPKRGRYKRYAEQLTAGETVVLSNKKEAIKARRAWQLYVPKNQRRHLRSTVRKCGSKGQYAVVIAQRERSDTR